MARFIATASGSAQSTASRLGSKNSPARATARGWAIGGEVLAYAADGGETDQVSVGITGGSNGTRTLLELGTWQRNADGKVIAADPRAEIILRAIEAAVRALAQVEGK